MPAGVLLLHGSSGRPPTGRADLLRSFGANVIAPRWFGGPGQPGGICEVPLESFGPALDELAAADGRLVVIGTSKGAEAALLLATGARRATAGLRRAAGSVGGARSTDELAMACSVSG